MVFSDNDHIAKGCIVVSGSIALASSTRIWFISQLKGIITMLCVGSMVVNWLIEIMVDWLSDDKISYAHWEKHQVSERIVSGLYHSVSWSHEICWIVSSIKMSTTLPVVL